MSATHILKVRVPSHLRQRVHALAEREFITESVWLRRLISAAVNDRSSAPGQATARFIPTLLTTEARPRGARVCVRLRRDDLQLLRERAQSRGLPSATYVSVLVRVHLRQLAPLPQDELRALKCTVAELSSVGRNLNQISRAANQGLAVAVSQKDLRSVIQSCEGLRRHVSDLIQTNVRSWKVGHAETQD